MRLRLGEHHALEIKNLNPETEEQFIEVLRSSFPQLERGLLKEKGWKEITEREAYENGFQMGDSNTGKYYVRDPSKDIYHEPFIKLVKI